MGRPRRTLLEQHDDDAVICTPRYLQNAESPPPIARGAIVLSAVDDYIGQLKKVKKALIAIRELSLPKNASQLALLPLPNAQDILTFQTATLDFGIDSADFEINWYKKLRLKMESES